MRAAITAHRDSWVTEADFSVMAANGVTAVRLPVGYWALAVTASDAAPFVEGAYKYIDLAMQWGQQHGTTLVGLSALDHDRSLTTLCSVDHLAVACSTQDKGSLIVHACTARCASVVPQQTSITSNLRAAGSAWFT